LGLVPVYNSTHLTEIAVIKSKLEAGGIELFVQNHQHAQMAHIDILALGGMNVLVPEEQVEEARAIIDESGDFVDTDMFEDYNPPWHKKPPYKANIWPVVICLILALFIIVFTRFDVFSIFLIVFAVFLFHAQEKATKLQIEKGKLHEP